MSKYERKQRHGFYVCHDDVIDFLDTLPPEEVKVILIACGAYSRALLDDLDDEPRQIKGISAVGRITYTRMTNDIRCDAQKYKETSEQNAKNRIGKGDKDGTDDTEEKPPPPPSNMVDDGRRRSTTVDDGRRRSTTVDDGRPIEYNRTPKGIPIGSHHQPTGTRAEGEPEPDPTLNTNGHEAITKSGAGAEDERREYLNHQAETFFRSSPPITDEQWRKLRVIDNAYITSTMTKVVVSGNRISNIWAYVIASFEHLSGKQEGTNNATPSREQEMIELAKICIETD